jgi:hypothetical protein
MLNILKAKKIIYFTILLVIIIPLCVVFLNGYLAEHYNWNDRNANQISTVLLWVSFSGIIIVFFENYLMSVASVKIYILNFMFLVFWLILFIFFQLIKGLGNVIG